MDREDSAPLSLRSSRPATSPGAAGRAATTLAADPAAIAKCFPDRRPAPAVMTIFGAGGDLTKRLVVPALYNLVRGGMLPDSFAIIGIDHNEMTTQEWCQSLTEMMQGFVRADGRSGAIDEQAWSWLTRRMHYMQGDFTQAETYRRLEKLLSEQFARQGGSANALFYMAVAGRFFGPVIEQLGGAGLMRQSENAWRRVIVEKPFGHDFASAAALNAKILKVLTEDQIYRIDHFLGKETVRTSWCCASPTASSNRCGIATTSITCRLPRRKPWAWSTAAGSTKRPVRYETWCRTICSSSLP